MFSDILKFTLTELEQNVYRADLTARGILRLLHSKREMHFFAFRNPSLSILLLSPEVVALTFQILGLARCCVFCQRFLNGGPTRSASLPDFLVHIRRRLLLFEFRQRSGRELHLALLEGYLQKVSPRYAGVSTR